MFKCITKISIIAALALAPYEAWSLDFSTPEASAQPERVDERESTDDHSYLPPWMRTQAEAEAQPVAQMPEKETAALDQRAKAAHRAAKRRRRFAQDFDLF
jgi:hypothetical protein